MCKLKRDGGLSLRKISLRNETFLRKCFGLTYVYFVCNFLCIFFRHFCYIYIYIVCTLMVETLIWLLDGRIITLGKPLKFSMIS